MKKILQVEMNWLILILAGCMEVAFTFCLGKTKKTSGSEELFLYNHLDNIYCRT